MSPESSKIKLRRNEKRLTKSQREDIALLNRGAPETEMVEDYLGLFEHGPGCVEPSCNCFFNYMGTRGGNILHNLLTADDAAMDHLTVLFRHSGHMISPGITSRRFREEAYKELENEV